LIFNILTDIPQRQPKIPNTSSTVRLEDLSLMIGMLQALRSNLKVFTNLYNLQTK